MQFRVGVMVLATLIIAAILVLLFGEMPRVVRGTYTVNIVFREAPGVSEGTPVRKSGVLIGRVSQRPELRRDGRVLLTARIDADRPIYPQEICRVNYTALGDARIEFALPPGTEISGDPVPTNHTFMGVRSQEPLQMVNQMQNDLRGVIDAVTRTSEALEVTARKINHILDSNEGQITTTFQQANRTMVSIERTMNAANKVMDDPELIEKLKRSLTDLPELLQDTRRAVVRVERTFDLAERNLQRIDSFTESLRESGTPLLQRVDSVMGNLDEMTGQIASFSKVLNSDQGTLGRLVRNPDVYDQLQKTLCEVNQLLRDARPIMDDARVFTDKIARHPEVLGVRGALERRPGIK